MQKEELIQEADHWFADQEIEWHGFFDAGASYVELETEHIQPLAKMLKENYPGLAKLNADDDRIEILFEDGPIYVKDNPVDREEQDNADYSFFRAATWLMEQVFERRIKTPLYAR